MRLMTLNQYMKMSKPVLIRKITKTLTAMPKVKLARMCYNITKSKLPRLRTIRQKALPKPKKKKEKLTKAEKKRRQKKLSALNKWRVSQGMKKIVIK